MGWEPRAVVNVYFLLQNTGAVYGAERATLDLAQGLTASEDIDVHLLIIEERRLVQKENVLLETVRDAGLPFSLIPALRRFSLNVVRGTHATLRDTPEVVLHTVGYKATVHGGFAAHGGRLCPIVSTVHGWLFRPDFKEKFYGWVELQALRRFDRVVVLSRFYQELLHSMGLRHRQVVRIPSGIDTAAMEASADASPAEESGLFTIGMMGRFSEEKNHEMLLRAIQLLRDEGTKVQLVLAGDGPTERRVQQQVKEMRLEQQVRFLGYLPREEVLPHLQLLVLCSKMENLPCSVLEAMAWKKPVVATAVGGLPDLIDEGKTGYLVPLDDAALLARRIKDLVTNRELTRRLGEAGRAKLEAEFSIQRSVARHASLYRSLWAER